jgi:hypothetical protein
MKSRLLAGVLSNISGKGVAKGSGSIFLANPSFHLCLQAFMLETARPTQSFAQYGQTTIIFINPSIIGQHQVFQSKNVRLF